MSQPVLTVTPRTPVSEATTVLLDAGVHALPVVDADGRLAGIVTEIDLLRGRIEPDPRAHLARVLRHTDRPPCLVGDVMTRDVEALPPDADAAAFATLMMADQRHAVPVVDRGRVLGIVTRRDLLRTLARRDADLGRDVRARLAAEGDAGWWDVDVLNGVVTLTGDNDARHRHVAEALILGVPGVVRLAFAAGAAQVVARGAGSGGQLPA